MQRPNLSYACIAVTFLVTSSLLVADDKVLAPVSERFRTRESADIPDFQRHIVPLLGRLGCNSAKCHGSFQGQGGFRLSLFGFDFERDHSELHAKASSGKRNRLNAKDPQRSLIVTKPSQQIEHEGGQRFELDSWEHHLLLKWISAGGKGASQRVQSDTYKDKVKPGEQFFVEKIKPILENNCYECHGFNNRKGSFQLNSRAELLAGGERGAAIVVGKPDKSLLIKAVHYEDEDLQMPPAGKLKRQQIADLERWVQMGAPWPDAYEKRGAGETNQVLKQLHYEPAELLFSKEIQNSQIRIIAEWENGDREDVTCLCRFQSNDDAVVSVDRNGNARSLGPGDTHIVAFYDNGVAAIPVIRPYSDSPPRQLAPANHPIDRFVNQKLNKLGISASEVCTDAEFLRRVSIDLTGTLPTPDEVIEFLKDSSPKKRVSKVDELLKRPAYAAWWANKLCDFTGCNPKSIASLLEVAREDGYVKASMWYDWIYARVARNEPYDRLVAGIMLANINEDDGKGMPYFWTRQSLKEPKDTAMSVAHAFLGIQLQCAECHKHPFDRWTQADFNDFARFFTSLPRGRRRVPVQQAKKELELRLLRSHQVTLKAGDDPRKPIMDWMQQKDNPWFAQAFVNRVWAGYFHVGIVDPPDQFTPANPPSNPKLLEWLTQGFIQSGYDMKWLHRQILTSQTYQRSWKPNAGNRTDRRNFSRAIPRRIPAEVVYDAMKQATAANEKLQSVRNNLQRRASGHLSMRMAGTHAMKVFGKPDRSINCDCERVNEPTLLQAIFTQNDPLVRMRIADSGWIIEIAEAEESNKSIDPTKLVEQVWLRTVNRMPRKTEMARALQHLKSVDSMSAGISDLMWALLNTKEFLLNH